MLLSRKKLYRIKKTKKQSRKQRKQRNKKKYRKRKGGKTRAKRKPLNLRKRTMKLYGGNKIKKKSSKLHGGKNRKRRSNQSGRGNDAMTGGGSTIRRCIGPLCSRDDAVDDAVDDAGDVVANYIPVNTNQYTQDPFNDRQINAIRAMEKERYLTIMNKIDPDSGVATNPIIVLVSLKSQEEIQQETGEEMRNLFNEDGDDEPKELNFDPDLPLLRTSLRSLQNPFAHPA